jgi:hypothetical protein
MQKIQTQEAQAQTQGPVEIDAQQLHLIGGGSPKGTWGSAEDAVVATLSEDPSPKGTW